MVWQLVRNSDLRPMLDLLFTLCIFNKIPRGLVSTLKYWCRIEDAKAKSWSRERWWDFNEVFRLSYI